MILVRNCTSNGSSKWHIYKEKQKQKIHHQQKPLCSSTTTQLHKMKGKNKHTTIQANTLNQAQNKIQGKFGQICKKCIQILQTPEKQKTRPENTENPGNILKQMKEQVKNP